MATCQFYTENPSCYSGKSKQDADNPETKQNFKQIRIENMYKEYVYERVGFAFTSGWWTRWREFFQPMPERSKT